MKLNGDRLIIFISLIFVFAAGAASIMNSQRQSTETIIIKQNSASSDDSSTSGKTGAEAETSVREQLPIMININTADSQELMQLNGIGEVLSSAIIEYRSENGGFRNIEELMKVPGIGEKLFAGLRNSVYVDDPVYDETASEDESAAVPAETAAQEPVEPAEEEFVPEDNVMVNINTADLDELLLLPNVDEAVAEEIISLRERLGGFEHVYELVFLTTVTQNEAADIMDHVYVEEQNGE